MRKVFLLVTAIVFAFQVNVRADEGMWLLSLIGQVNMDEMSEMGLQLTAEQIYSINQASLKDAVGALDGGYANLIANELLMKDNKSETTVGVYLDRRIEYVPSILAILKSGLVYVPLDIDYPDSRLKYVIEDSGIEKIITSAKFLESIASLDTDNILLENIDHSKKEIDNPILKIYPENAAYIIYTSGSTGSPKGDEDPD